MKFNMPKAVFCGLALIAAAIFFGPGATPAGAGWWNQDAPFMERLAAVELQLSRLSVKYSGHEILYHTGLRR